MNQVVATGFLERFLLQVEIAENGREAVERVMQEAFDLVLMDIQMPEMDGYEATRQIRQEERLATIPIVAMTADAMAEDRERCLQSGMDDYLAKPIDPDALAKVLRRWLPDDGEVSVPSLPSPSRVEEEDDTLPAQLPGIDVAEGVGRLNGDRVLFRDLLLDFYGHFHDTGSRLADTPAEGGGEGLRREIHALKGVAGNLAAHGLYVAAQRVDEGIRNGRPLGDEDLRPFLDELRRVMDGIAALDTGSEEQGGVVADPDLELRQFAEPLQRLRGMLSEGRYDAVPLWGELRSELRGLLQEGRFEPIDQAMQNLQFAAALELLDGLDIQGTPLA